MGSIKKIFGKLKSNASCCKEGQKQHHALCKIAIVGSPNVGKSVIFGRLTGTYVTVSNYPGTTVEVTRGKAKIGEVEFEVTDTPGMYAFFSITEEERVARRILMEESPDIVLHVIDGKNFERMLPLTLQLLEADLPVILVLNIIDEAEKVGMKIDLGVLEKELKVPVVATVGTTGKGMDILKGKIEAFVSGGACGRRPREIQGLLPVSPLEAKLAQQTARAVRHKDTTDIFQMSLETIELLLKNEYNVSKRSIALLLLQEDDEIIPKVRSSEPQVFDEIRRVVDEVKNFCHEPVSYVISLQRQQEASRIAGISVEHLPVGQFPFRERLSRLMIHPVTGLPILLLILYYGLYKFVGEFGAGIVVDFIETDIFERHINPWITRILTASIPWQVLRDLFVGEYGVITLGVRYAVALILPIVTTFFIAFAVIEDTGYLPRLALLIDRLFKKIGLTGRAVIPMVLGLGCDTMATMVTRTLPTKRERIIATLLLALAIPCSAQLGVILSLLEGNPAGLWVWVGVLSLVFLLVGFLSSMVLPGEAPSFYMEIPPLRLPKLSNVLIKTLTRVQWYFAEIFPMFVLASVIIWLGQLMGLFDIAVRFLEYPVRWIGLPDKAAVAFLFGFFRRDYGVAGLYDIKQSGLLSGNQVVVACVALTLFLPCVAQFLMNVKERGLRAGVFMSVFVLFISFTVAFLVNLALVTFGVNL
ncbi:MAG TPA: ferrous iron transport protein B [Candidatus Omnitrophica bacterium]|nr:ferrous iron transport protein B [Candidatus Omnitrophota bacterium]